MGVNIRYKKNESHLRKVVIIMIQNRDHIIFTILNIKRLINANTFLRWVSICALFGFGFVIAFISISKFIAISAPLIPIAISIVALSIIIGSIRGVIGFISDSEAAKFADSKLYLHERLSTALEILNRERISEMAELQLEDTAKLAVSLDLKTISPSIFPLTAKLLPLAVIALTALFFIPPLYTDPSEVSPIVREAIRKSGNELKNSAEYADKNLLSDELRKLASEMKQIGDKLEQEPITKREALRDLSNLTRKMEAMKIIGEVAKELEGDITPEKRRVLNELLTKLADNLRDIPDMRDLSKEVIKAQSMDLSIEALKELSAALDNMRFGIPDARELQAMSDQLAKARQEIGMITPVLVRSVEPGGSQETEEGAGRMGGTAPGKDTISGDGLSLPSQEPSGQGYESELEGQISETGRSLPVFSESDLKKGEALVSYQEIYVKYRDAADDAITNVRIPWVYREQVKRYFDGIKNYDNQN